MTADILTVHRLVQTVVQASLSPEDQQQWADAAVRVVAAAFPLGSVGVTSWPTCALLLPHALAVVDYAETLDVGSEAAALLLNEAAFYLRSRGQYRQALTLQAGPDHFRRVLGDDHRNTMRAMMNLAATRWRLRDLQGARDLLE